MTVKTEKYFRRPFEVDAVRLTEENFNDVANWCGGVIRQTDERGNGLEKYIFVHTHTPMTERQKMAFVGQWVLKTDKGYKVFTDQAFHKMFVARDESGFVMGQLEDKTVDDASEALDNLNKGKFPTPNDVKLQAGLKGLKPSDWKEPKS